MTKLLEEAIAQLKTRPISEQDSIRSSLQGIYAIENQVKIDTSIQR
jgi:hypothetical protein